jgi:hypothetical protein
MAATTNAFNNTNQNQFGGMNFTDWSQVADMFGTSVVQALQQNNVALNQVGSVIGKLGIAQQTSSGTSGQFGASNPQNISSGFTLADAINQQQGGSGSAQQSNSGTINMTGWQNPDYATNLLGAQALEAVGLNPSKTMTVNPQPSAVTSSQDFAKSGVSSVAGPQTFDISQAPMPNPNPSIGSVFGAVKPLNPTVSGPMTQQPANTNPNWANWSTAQQNAYMRQQGMHPAERATYSQEQNQIQQNIKQGNYLNPTVQATGAQATQPQAFATPPPIPTIQTPQVSSQVPASTGTLPQPPAAPGNAIAGSPFGPISSLSPSATPPGPSSMPPGYGTAIKHMAGGGSVGGTDTIPAMLTPGEYVINRDAAQQIGRGRLDQLNAEGGRLHMQDGGSIPGASPSYGYSPGADAQSFAFQQLSPQEQVVLQGGGAAGQRVQQKFNQLVNNYQGSSGTPTPMSAQMGMNNPAATTAQVHPTAPAAPAGQPQQQKPAGYSGSLDQWLAQYGHTPQGQAYIAQNGNVNEVQRYLQNLTTPQTTPATSPATSMPAYTDTAPRASLVSAPAGYGAAPRAELVGLPAGQGEAYDPKTYGINTGASGAAGMAGNIAGAIGQIAQAFTKGAGASQPYKWIQSAIPNPADLKSQTPDIVLQGHQVGKPNTPGGYVLMAQPNDQPREDTYLS